jgi:hypothetical protein
MQVTQDHSYRFPNAWFVFVIFLTPPFVMFALILRDFLSVLGAQGDIDAPGPTLIGAAISCLVAVGFATVIANAFPDIRVDALGIQVRFCVPLFILWLRLPWSSITKVTEQEEPAPRLFRDHRPNLVVFSSALPAFYHIPTAWFAFSRRRGFIITKRIQGYTELARALQDRHRLW